jgi:ACS family glucarate transporter-like MFS transporter
MQRYGWRVSFILAGIVGVALALLWRSIVADRPEHHAAVNAAELELIRHARPSSLQPARMANVPWRLMLSNRSVWGVLLGYLCQGFPIYFYHTWFFIYLVQVRGFSVTHGSLWGTTPYITITVLAPLGGWFSDRAVKKWGSNNGRRIAVWTGMGLSAALLWLGSHAAGAVAATVLLALGAGFNMFAAVTFWAACIDLSPSFTGSLSGLMNTFGNLGGWLSPIVSAYIAVHFGWDKALYCAAVVTVFSGIFFSMVKAGQSLETNPLSAVEATR